MVIFSFEFTSFLSPPTNSETAEDVIKLYRRRKELFMGTNLGVVPEEK